MNTDYDFRLKHISVKKLFNQYDYELNIDNPLSIIIAPNGYGKTTIFHLINATLAADVTSLNYLRTIPFEEFTCILSDGSCVFLSRHTLHNGSTYKVTRNIIDLGINYFFRINTHYSIKKGCIMDSTFEYTLDYLSFYNGHGDAFLTNDSRIDRVDLFTHLLSDVALKQLKLLEDTKCFCPLYFISANRLQSQKKKLSSRESMRYYPYRDSGPIYEPVNFLDLADKDLSEIVKLMKKEYELRKAEAQNKLPSVFLQSKSSSMPSYEEFRVKWDSYISQLKEFHSLGFIDDDISSLFDIAETDYSGKAEFLNVYLDSFASTLEPLTKNYDSFRLLKEILDSRNQITGKSVSFSDDGVRFHVASSDRELKLSSLSSGEKNDFIMFYNLLFKTKELGIVLIDEPEISLHIEWQESFIDHLGDIAKKNKLQALVATHSPHIINGYFDLIREL